jgi:pimeloyl-ACP methyl ester carboxylesterase
MRGRTFLAAAVGVVTLAACSTSADVEIGAPPSSTGAAPGSTASPTPTDQPPADQTPTTGARPAEVAPVAWQACPPTDGEDVQGWECGTIQVPLDYAQPDGETITIALTRHRATGDSQRIGSLVVNPGGPGASGIEAVRGLLDLLPSDVPARFDLVGFDPRGVGASSAVDCVSDKALDAGADLDGTPDTPQEIDALVDQLSSTGATCSAAQSGLLPHLGTTSSARDLDRIRQAVGDEKLTYLGYSYGTSLGATYADLFPDKVRALVLDGVIDPSVGVDAAGSASAEQFYGTQDFGGAFDRFAEACSKVSTCSAGPDPKQLMEQVRAAVEKAPVGAETIEAEDGRRLTPGLFETGINFALYNASFWPFLSVALRDAADGDGSALIRLADEYNDRNPDGTWKNGLEAYRAITCADFPERPTVDEARSAYSSIAGTGSDVPPNLPNPNCVDWPATAEPLPKVGPADTPPILVVGTKGDPATPYANTAAMAKALGNGVVLTWEGDGHTAFAGPSQCINEAVAGYLVDLTVPAEGAICPAVDGGSTAGSGSAYHVDPSVLTLPLERALRAGGATDAQATCVSKAVSEGLDETQLTHFALGLDQAGLTREVAKAAQSC